MIPPSWLRLLRRSTLLLATGAGALATIYFSHWDDRFWLLLKERATPVAQRLSSVWLPDYQAVIEAKALPGLAEDETSGLTYNPASGTLFAVTGRNPSLVELSRDGEVLRRIELRGFSDPEAVEVLDAGRMAIVDERRSTLLAFDLEQLAPTLYAENLQAHPLGFADAGNKGFEGMAWDARSQTLLLAKERAPLGLFSMPFASDEQEVGALSALSYGNLGVRDISSLSIDPRTGHTLVLSDESRLLLELDRSGEPVSFLSLSAGLNGLARSIRQAEGVAMDEQGDIYIVAEPNLFYRFRRARPDAS